MPLPTPSENEDQSAFFERCMSELSDEYTDESQRSAVCHRQWSHEDSQEDSEPKENSRMRSTPIRQFAKTDIDLDAIRRVAGNPNLAENEVFDFPKFVIARSGRNHNNTEITSEAQKQAAPLWAGKPIYFEDHETRASNQIARIYNAWAEDTKGETVTYGRAYAIRTQSKADLLSDIQNGIHREMSCGYYPLQSECVLCQSDTTRTDCPTHSSSPDYYARDLAIKPDHVSFVGRPGVEGAGLCLNSRAKDEPQADKQLLEDGRVYRESMTREFERWYRLNDPTADPGDVRLLASKLNARELARLADIQERKYRQIVPSGDQVLSAPKEEDVKAAEQRTMEEIKNSLRKGA